MSTNNKPSIRRAYQYKKQQSLTNNIIKNEKEKKENFGCTRENTNIQMKQVKEDKKILNYNRIKKDKESDKKNNELPNIKTNFNRYKRNSGINYNYKYVNQNNNDQYKKKDSILKKSQKDRDNNNKNRNRSKNNEINKNNKNTLTPLKRNNTKNGINRENYNILKKKDQKYSFNSIFYKSMLLIISSVIKNNIKKEFLHKFLSKLNNYNLKINKVDEFEYRKNRKQFAFIKINENNIEILQKKSKRDNFQKDDNENNYNDNDYNPFESDDYKKAKLNDRLDFEDDIIGKEELNKKGKNYDKKKSEKESQEYKDVGKKVSKIKEKIRLYGFINRGNNCYLNSSLQLLTRIKELEENIMNFKEAKDCSCITNGELTIEFKEILKNIREGSQRVSPDRLKKVMGKINDIYYSCAQEDANEFISNFLDALLSETSDINSLDKLKIFEIDKNDKEAYKSYKTFCRKFYDRRGYSFLLDLFYGIIKIEKKCHNCESINSIKFSPYNMLKLPIYEFYNNSSINFIDVLNKYISRYKSEDISCKNCNQKELYIYTSIITLPKYLIVFFGRIADDKYIRTNIAYPENFDFYNYFNISKKNINCPKYKLNCVIEHSGGLSSGHYTSLCSINQNWYRFSDEYYSESSSFQSQNAIILLYKSVKFE